MIAFSMPWLLNIEHGFPANINYADELKKRLNNVNKLCLDKNKKLENKNNWIRKIFYLLIIKYEEQGLRFKTLKEF